MPEWNLVTHRSQTSNSKASQANQRSLVLASVVLACSVLATQVGCTKLRNAALQDGLVPPSQSAMAIRMNQESDGESVETYLAETSTSMDSPQAKIVGVFEVEESESLPKVTLTARLPVQVPPAPSIASASNPLVATQSNDVAESCEHDEQCDCHPTIQAPKLAVVEPFDPGDFSKDETNFIPIAPSIESAQSQQKFEGREENTLPDRYVLNTNDPSARDLLAPIQAKDPLPQIQNQRAEVRKDDVAQTIPVKKLSPLRPVDGNGPTGGSDAMIVLQAKSSRIANPIVKLNAEPIRGSLQVSSSDKPVEVQQAEPQTSTNQLTASKVDVKEDGDTKEVVTGSPWSPLREIRVAEISREMALGETLSSRNGLSSQSSNDVAVEETPVPMTPEQRLSPKVEPISAPIEVVTEAKITPQVVAHEEAEKTESKDFVTKSGGFEGSPIAPASYADTDPASGGNFSPLDLVASENNGFSPSKMPAVQSCECEVANCNCERSSEVFAEAPVGEVYAEAVEQFKREMASAESWVPPTQVERRVPEEPVAAEQNTFQPEMISGSPVKLPSLDQIDQELAIARGTVNQFSPLPVRSAAQTLPPVETLGSDIAKVGHAERLDAPMAASVKTSVAVEPMQPISLRQQVDETIAKVKFAIANESDTGAKNGLEVNLRLLELLGQQTDQLDKSDRMINNDQKRSLQHQLDALAAMLTNEQKSMDASATTLDSLKQAVEELESLAEMRVTNGLFCTQISGFGKFKSFASSTFSPNQKMLIYCEVENQTSVEVQNGTGAMEHRTKLLGRYVVYDREGRTVQQEVFPPIEDVARNRRRDFYLYFPIQLKDLPVGEYRLELMIEDLNGSKTASLQPGIHFSVQ